MPENSARTECLVFKETPLMSKIGKENEGWLGSSCNKDLGPAFLNHRTAESLRLEKMSRIPKPNPNPSYCAHNHVHQGHVSTVLGHLQPRMVTPTLPAKPAKTTLAGQVTATSVRAASSNGCLPNHSFASCCCPAFQQPAAPRASPSLAVVSSPTCSNSPALRVSVQAAARRHGAAPATLVSRRNFNMADRWEAIWIVAHLHNAQQ